MPVPYIFRAGDPVDADKINDDFANVLEEIGIAVDGASADLIASIEALNNEYQQTKSKVSRLDNNTCKLTGTQTITGNKTFTGSVTVPASTADNSALRLTKWSVNSTGSKGGMKLGCGLVINWITTSNTTTWNFSIGFSTTNYTVVSTRLYSNNYDHPAGFYDRQTGSVKFGGPGSETYSWIAIGI